MTPDLSNQVALVTGAGRGIGRAIAEALAKCGCLVYLAARSGEELERAASGIEHSGGRAIALPLDVSDETQIVNAFERLGKEQGRLDALVNNAGIGLFGPVAEVKARDIDQMHAVNVRGTLLCCREALKLMIPAKSGYIINLASSVVIGGYPNQSAYSASKHAVMGLTKSLAKEVQPHGIRVSAILPGGVDTEMVRAARPDLAREDLISTEEIGRTVLYLLSLGPTSAAVDEIYIRRTTSSPF